MKKYRILQPRSLRVPVNPEFYAHNAMQEVWSGNTPPFVDPSEKDSKQVAQERFLILDLGFISCGIGWMKIDEKGATRLPSNYEIVQPVAQLRDLEPTHEAELNLEIEDKRLYASDNYPNRRDWQAITQIVGLESAFQVSASEEKGTGDSVRLIDEPLLRKTRYIKLGRRVRQLEGRIIEPPIYV